MERVYLHIGLPKTGTTYLQEVLWDNRAVLEQDGFLLPGRNRREHLWAALECLEEDMSVRAPAALGALDRVCAQIAESALPVAVVSHEFFCGATHEQAERLVARLAPAEVHVVVTARDTASLFAAGWHEMVKNGAHLSIEEAAAREPSNEFSWKTWDLGGVLDRWRGVVPDERVHILPMPKGEPPSAHWDHLASVLGVTTGIRPPATAMNTSIGAVQVQLLRRISPELAAFRKRAVDRGVWLRGYLAEKHLSAQDGERFALPPAVLEDCRRRSRRAVDLIASSGFDVVGDLDGLLVGDQAPERRALDEITDDELFAAAGRLIADMIADVRTLTDRVAALERDLAEASKPPPEPEPTGGLVRRAARRVRRGPGAD